VLFSSEYNCLLYRRPTQPLPQLEGVKEINGEYIAIPANIDNLQILKRSGFPVVAPMEVSNYDWPIKRPWSGLPHQRVTANFLCLNRRAFCFNDMGTMKTLSALWAADFLMEQSNEPFRALVIAPLSILKAVWGMHIFNHFAGRRSYKILYGSHESRRKKLAEEADFYIINPDGLTCGIPSDPRKTLYGLAKELQQRDDIKLAIIDEAGGYRCHTTKRHRAARSIIGSRPYLWLLTGTPTPNGPLDAYGLARLAGTTNGESFRSYKERVMIHVSQWVWTPRVGSLEATNQLLQPAIRFNSEFLKLPPCTAEQREVEMSTEQKHAWNALKKEAVLALQSGALVHAVNEAALRIKLIQVAAGCVYDENHASHGLNPTSRLAEVESIIEETDRKIVIFAPLTNVLGLLYDKLKKWERVILNGDVPQRERAEILRRFGDRSNSLRICLADPACASHGINEFVSAGVCVWYAPTDKNELYRQGIKRLDRPGQIGPVKIIQLVSTRLEKEIYERLDRNESMQGLILKFAEEK
jgi:SNF2 family DNA or RNA helicase